MEKENSFDVLMMTLNSSMWTKLLFHEKISYLLDYTKLHPEDTEKVGIAWFEEGKIFTLNSGTLSKILKIKKNTITKNFNARKYEYISPSK